MQAGYRSVGLPSSVEQQEKLISIVKHAAYEEKGIDGKPTTIFTGVNVQVVAGTKEDETTGVGNLVIGSNESPGSQTGSNNLVMGSTDQSLHQFWRDSRRIPQRHLRPERDGAGLQQHRLRPRRFGHRRQGKRR
jgi:hypothetical protein